MKKIILLASLFAASVAMAGFVGPGGATVTSVVEAGKAADKTMVVLEGKIVRQHDKKHYDFQDASGTIKIEVDHDKWPAGEITPQTRVRLTGEVDRDWRGIDVEVDQIEILR
ncbi:YgiW/YdeI family stress tolerance OB fold protein [Andreprevotia chitinilytica]|uniref:YgiW/YdeI family stress tolerance OB fold protein n=1 Tax=Andreprevotia chitinilytica TaxID=396808 RepID=UPI0005533F35|nr:NirD/YgiW/YdeI family stress tolerance protein [Andreprevotia chitinilytica]